MSMKNFVRKHREFIDDYTGFSSNDNDRIEWIMNDEFLYQLARSFGVRI